MITLRKLAVAFLLLVAMLSLASGWIAPDYATQNRDFLTQPPSRQFPLGTDELGRDNLSRLLSGLRLSLLLAAAGAAVSCAVAMLFGALSGFAGGITEALLLNTISLVESVPWLFL